MIVARLTVSIPCLGNEGDRVVVDPEHPVKEGDWVAVEDGDGLLFVPYTSGLPNLGGVYGVVAANTEAANAFPMLLGLIDRLTRSSPPAPG